MKMKAKRLLCLVLALSMTFLTFGCTKPGEESQVESQEESKESVVHFLHTYEKVDSVPSTCSVAGYDVMECTVCGARKEEPLPLAAHNPVASDPDDYITFVPCADCGKLVLRDSEHLYDDEFVYNLTDEKIAEDKTVYDALMQAIADADRYDPKYSFVKDSDQYKKNKDFEHNYYDPFYDTVEYAIEQYQYSYVFYCVNDNEEWKECYDKASDYYNDMLELYYTVFRPVHETEYRDYFFSEEDGWTPEDIENALTMSDLYSDGRASELRSLADDYLMEFRDLKDPAQSSKVPTIFTKFVECNTELAQLFGYDDYMDYAYDSVYTRDYTVEDVAKMREYVKTYLGGDTILNLYKKYAACGDDYYYADILGDSAEKSIFDNQDAINLVDSFFKTMKSDAYKKPIDFHSTFNELLRGGNYYRGASDHAFSYYLSTKDNTILYFGPGYYSSAFTFVHEFGHYTNNIYNKGADISMDLDETQSQGNEMLFLAYIRSFLEEKGESDSFLAIKYTQLLNALQTILLSTAVDEFEEIVYTLEYKGDDETIKGILSDGVISSREYDTLFQRVSEPYGLNNLYNPIYWRYVVIEAPGYYISYAMSMIPVLTLFIKSQNEGFEAAQEAYFKLFTFTDVEGMAHEDVNGELVVDATTAEVLHYAGLSTPFEEETYKALSTLINGKTK